MRVRKVSIVAADGGALPVSPKPLLPKLGQRAGSAIYTDRYENPYRLAEDHRRVRVWLETLGYLEATVADPVVTRDPTKNEIEILWKVTPGVRYAYGEVTFAQVPDEVRGEVERLAKASTGGTDVDLEVVRVARYDMAQAMQRAGYGHARMLVRFYVDKAARKVHVTHLADPGPKTRIGKVHVTGASRVSEADVLARAGLVPGEPFSLAKKEKAEVDLLDTGAFAAATVATTADVETYLGDVPDSGGVVPDDRVGPDGSLLPRPLSELVDLDVRVHEAPRVKLSLRATAEADPTRGDALVSFGADFRNALGSLRHVSARATVGYGLFARGDEREPLGLYGDVLLQLTRPGLFGRLGDARLFAQGKDALLPGYHFREGRAGPGLRTAFGRKAYLDLTGVYRLGATRGLGAISPEERARVRLPKDDDSHGAEMTGELVWDERDDPAETMSGHLLALRGAYAPGGSLSSHRYGLVAPEGRVFLRFSPSFALGLHASYGAVVGESDAGVPFGPRLFGGGAWSFRGVGRDRLSPTAVACDDGTCRDRFVGGLSVFQSQLELRFLPPLGQTGLTTFVDVGGAGVRRDPFADGLTVAAGLGPRVRLWYLPIAIDLAYRFRDRGEADRGVLVFLRIGEAF